MKTIALPYTFFHLPINNLTAGHQANDYRKDLIRTTQGTNAFLKKATRVFTTNYLMDAANELLKQNLLGTDINMEFLTLSIRVYGALFLQSFAKNASVFYAKASAYRGINSAGHGASYSLFN
jgi:hypothetical protein